MNKALCNTKQLKQRDLINKKGINCYNKQSLSVVAFCYYKERYQPKLYPLLL